MNSLGVVLGLVALVVVGAVVTVACRSRPEPAPAAAPADVPGRLEADVRRLAVDLSPRDAAHVANLDRAAAWIRDELAATGATVELQRFEADGDSFANVVATYGPATGPRLVVGAHYDAAGPLPGADDNASGVAGLLELGRRLGQRPPARRVDLVAWTLEEPPHFALPTMGSAVHARSLRAAGVELTAAISLEMIGCFSDAPGSQRYPDPAMARAYGDRGDFIAIVGRPADAALIGRVEVAFKAAGGVRALTIAAPPEVPGVDLSDHRSYWAAGYPAVMITDTAFYRNERYHTPDDTPDTLDYRRMAQVVDGVMHTITALTSD